MGMSLLQYLNAAAETKSEGVVTFKGNRVTKATISGMQKLCSIKDAEELWKMINEHGGYEALEDE